MTDDRRSEAESPELDLNTGEGAAEPGGDAPLATPAPSRVGSREPGDTDDVGGTDGMDASTGGMAGTSR